MKKLIFGLLGLALLLFNSCNKEVQRPSSDSPGLVKLKSWYYQSNFRGSEAGHYRFDSQNRRIKYEIYRDSSLWRSFRYVWTNNSNGRLTSEAYLLKDGDSTFSSKFFWDQTTGFLDSVIFSGGDKLIYQIKLDQYRRPELIEKFNYYFSGWEYLHDSIYDGMIVRRLYCSSDDVQDTIETVYNHDDYTDFYAPFRYIPAFNELNRNAYLKQRKENFYTYEGMSKGFVTKWLWENGSNTASEEFSYE